MNSPNLLSCARPSPEFSPNARIPTLPSFAREREETHAETAFQATLTLRRIGLVACGEQATINPALRDADDDAVALFGDHSDENIGVDEVAFTNDVEHHVVNLNPTART